MKSSNFIFKFILVMMISMGISQIAQSQTAIDKAKQLMSNYDYQKAIELLNTHFQANPPSTDDARLLAECYILTNNSEQAMNWMQKVVDGKNANAQDHLKFARLLKNNGLYDQAINQFENYQKIMPAEKDKATAWIKSCKDAQNWLKNPLFFDVTNAEIFNSENAEFGLMPFESGYLITSDRRLDNVVYTKEQLYGWTGKPYLKLLFMEGNNPQNFKTIDELNYKYHNGPATYNDNTKKLYYTRTKMVRVTKKPINSDPTSWYDYSTAEEYVNRLEIFSAIYKEGQWTEVTPFAYNNPEEYNVGHPAISQDGKVLYFVCDMPGGFGGSDIYYCELNSDNTWGAPKNAGNVLNSEGDEVFPGFAADGLLYFSSDGHPGMGGLDLFSAKGNRNSWATPSNLKSPFNSNMDDFSIIFTETGKSGYLASNRSGGKGDDDIYRFSPAPPTNLILAVITKELLDDQTTATLGGVDITIHNNKTDNIQKMATNDKGFLYTKADCGTKYEITGNKDGYFAKVKQVETKCITRNDTVFVELTFEKIVIDKPIVIKNIYYDFDKWNIRPDAAIELNKLVVILKQNPSIEIELGSHTDCRGTDKYNEVLSQRRAESAVNYIIANGIDAKRITAKGYGEYVLVNKCKDDVPCSEPEHQENRRTEFKVTKINKGQVSEIKSTP